MNQSQDPEIDLQENDNDTRTYELSYHLTPTLSKEDADARIEEINSFIVERKGIILSQSNPEQFVLAYPISKSLKSVKTEYDRSYFGWLTFSSTGEVAVEIKKMLEKSDVTLRFLLIHSTIQEKKEEGEKKNETASKDEVVSDETVLSEEQLDKTIDQLVIS